MVHVSRYRCFASGSGGVEAARRQQGPSRTCAGKIAYARVGGSGIGDAATGLHHASERCGSGLAARGAGAASTAAAPHCVRSFGHPRWSADRDCWPLLGAAVLSNAARARLCRRRQYCRRALFSQGRSHRFASPVAVVVGSNPQVIVVILNDLIEAFAAATTTIPIVAII